jgi:hypothetical protein
MPDFTLTMSRHYIPQSVGDCFDRIVAAATEHHTNHGTVPTLAHIPVSITEYPREIGVLKVERAWGLGPHEIDLGVEA